MHKYNSSCKRCSNVATVNFVVTVVVVTVVIVIVAVFKVAVVVVVIVIVAVVIISIASIDNVIFVLGVVVSFPSSRTTTSTSCMPQPHLARVPKHLYRHNRSLCYIRIVKRIINTYQISKYCPPALPPPPSPSCLDLGSLRMVDLIATMITLQLHLIV